MPCGGIFPVFGNWVEKYLLQAADTPDPIDKCWQCDRTGPDHFCLEFDCFLHGSCVEKFLQTQEGEIVLKHGHEVRVGDRVLHAKKEEASDGAW